MVDKKFIAFVLEYERGWGSKIDDTLEFATKEERDSFVNDFNSINTETIVPDWYMVARAGEP